MILSRQRLGGLWSRFSGKASRSELADVTSTVTTSCASWGLTRFYTRGRADRRQARSVADGAAGAGAWRDERLRIGCVHGCTFDIDGYQTNFPIRRDAGVQRNGLSRDRRRARIRSGTLPRTRLSRPYIRALLSPRGSTPCRCRRLRFVEEQGFSALFRRPFQPRVDAEPAAFGGGSTCGSLT